MAKLNFDTIEELQQFFLENKLDIKNFSLLSDVQEVKIIEEQEVITEELLPESIDVALKTLAAMPTINAKIGDENIIYVDECDASKNACSTTRLKFLESYIWVNACDCEGNTTINLDIAINEEMMYNVSFIVKEKQADSPALQIKKDIVWKPNHHSS